MWGNETKRRIFDTKWMKTRAWAWESERNPMRDSMILKESADTDEYIQYTWNVKEMLNKTQIFSLSKRSYSSSSFLVFVRMLCIPLRVLCEIIFFPRGATCTFFIDDFRWHFFQHILEHMVAHWVLFTVCLYRTQIHTGNERRWKNDRGKKWRKQKTTKTALISYYKNNHAVVVLTRLVHGNFKYVYIEHLVFCAPCNALFDVDIWLCVLFVLNNEYIEAHLVFFFLHVSSSFEVLVVCVAMRFLYD